MVSFVRKQVAQSVWSLKFIHGICLYMQNIRIRRELIQRYVIFILIMNLVLRLRNIFIKTLYNLCQLWNSTYEGDNLEFVLKKIRRIMMAAERLRKSWYSLVSYVQQIKKGCNSWLNQGMQRKGNEVSYHVLQNV